MRTFDIAVCGCGPAGLAAALLLHRLGHRVRIFDQFDTPRPVGSGLLLQPTGLGVLAELNVLDSIAELGCKVDRLYGLVTSSQRVSLDVKYASLSADFCALGVHRAALFDVLYREAVKLSLPIETGIRIDRIRTTGHRVELFDRRTRIADFDLVVNALGANSPLSKHTARRRVLEYGALWVNVPWPTDASAQQFHANWLEQRYRRASHMAGVMPIGKAHRNSPKQAAFFWSVKRSDLQAWQSASIDEWKQKVGELWADAVHLLADVHSHEQLTFAQYDHFTAQRPFDDRIAHIGDAAHSTSPQLGQGANMALLDALALSRALQTHADIDAALPAYATMRRWHVRMFQWGSAIFTPFYQSDSRVLPWIRDWITAPLSRLPIGDKIVAQLVSGMTTAPLAGAKFRPVALAAKLARRDDALDAR